MSQTPVKEITLPENLRALSGKSLTGDQIEILHQTHQKMVGAADFFTDGKIGKLRMAVAPEIVKSYQDLKTNKTNVGIADFDNIANKGSIDDIVSYARNCGFNEDQVGEILVGVMGERMVDISLLKDQYVSITEEDNFTLLSSENKLNNILEESRKYKLSCVDNFYRKYPPILEKIRSADNLNSLQLIQLKFEKDLKNTPEDKFVLERLEIVVNSKINAIKKTAIDKNLNKENTTKESKSKEYYLALESALRYLRYCYPHEELGALVTVAETTIKQIARTRDKLSEITELFASSHQLAELFWPIRLGRTIKDPETLGIGKKTIERFTSSIFDNRLRTESAAFWFEKQTKLMPSYELYPNLVLIRSIESLMSSHLKLKGVNKNQPVKLMILVNDNNTLKLNLNPNSTYAEIVTALQHAAYEEVNPTLSQRYMLKKEAYKSKKRSNEYQEFYNHKEKRKLKLLGREFNLPLEKRIDGDYVVRLTTHTKNSTVLKNSPYSLFSVDSHKALVDIDLNHGRGIDISMKLAHRHFDGVQAKPFFTRFYSQLEKQHSSDIRHELTQPHLDFIFNAKPIKQSDQVVTKAPFFEANASVSYDDKYVKFVLNDRDNKKTVSPNILRAATISLANGAEDAHVLVAANTPSHTEGPHDNVQPVIVSLHPIKKIYDNFKDAQKKGLKAKFSKDELYRVIEWVNNTNEAVELAKKGLSAPAVLAAPTGHAEKIIYEVSKILHKGVTLLKESSGMFSPLPDLEVKPEFDDIIFYTAVGDTYGKKPNLLKPTANTGTIGYSQSTREINGKKENQAFYTIRKTPQQSQAAFSRFVIDDLLLYDKKREGKIGKTLKVLNKLIVEWENLITGKINIEDYDEILQSIYNQLGKESVCGYKNLESIGITSHTNLQGRLNIVFSQDAKDTIAPRKLESEKNTLYGFFTAVNQQL